MASFWKLFRCLSTVFPDGLDVDRIGEKKRGESKMPPNAENTALQFTDVVSRKVSRGGSESSELGIQSWSL